MSIDELDKIIPVSPPIVNRKIKPSVQSMDGSNFRIPPLIEAIHLKILMPVGMAIIIVAAVKYARVSTSIPTVNMWCAQTRKPKSPIEDMA
jgi:hypothetical protein